MFENLINGERVAGPRVSRNINPSDTRDLVDEYTQGDADQARVAIGAAQAAFPAWSVSAPQQRFNVLDAVGTEILARRADLGDLLAREEGKTLPEGHRHYVAEARHALQAASASGHGHAQRADRRCRLSRPVRRSQRVELWPTRAGSVRGGVPHGREDGLHARLKS